MYCYLGENNVLYNAEEDLEIRWEAPIKEILRSDVKIVGKIVELMTTRLLPKEI